MSTVSKNGTLNTVVGSAAQIIPGVEVAEQSKLGHETKPQLQQDRVGFSPASSLNNTGPGKQRSIKRFG